MIPLNQTIQLKHAFRLAHRRAASPIVGLLIFAALACRIRAGNLNVLVHEQDEMIEGTRGQEIINEKLKQPAPSSSKSAAVISNDKYGSQFGVVAKLGNQESADDRQIALMKQLGVTEVVWTPGEWATIERSPGSYAFSSEVERVLTRLRAAGLRSVIVLFRKNPIYPNPLDAMAYARYCGWMATALKEFPTAAFQIWNEPSNFDLRDYYSGTWNARGDAVRLCHFVTMMMAAAAAIRAVSPNVKIVANLEGPPLLRALADCPQALRDISGASLHPYSGKLPPESVPWGGPLIDLRDEVTLADANGSLISTRRIQTVDAPRRYLNRSLEAWITEYGYPTCEPTRRLKQFVCVTQEVQAAYETRGLLVGLSQQVALWTTYELADEGGYPADPEQNFGLVTSATDKFMPKLSFYSLQRVYQLLGHQLLGHQWRYIIQPPNDIVTLSWLGPYAGVSNSPIAGPQLVWFKVNNGYVAFIWQAGPYEYGAAGERVILRTNEKHSSEIRAIDLVTGQTIKPTQSPRPVKDESAELMVTSQPIAVPLLPDSQHQASVWLREIERPIRAKHVFSQRSREQAVINAFQDRS